MDMDKFANLQNNESIITQIKNAIAKEQNCFFLSTNSITEKEVYDMSEILKNNDIETIEFTFNTCEQTCFQHMSFICNISTTFILNGPIDNVGMKNLFSSHDKVRFRELTLTRTKLSTEGLEILYNFLMKNHITSLDLSENQFGEEQANLIGEIIRNSISITDLFIKRNKFSKTGIVTILESLLKNKSIDFLDLSFQLEDYSEVIEEYRSKKDGTTIEFFADDNNNFEF